MTSRKQEISLRGLQNAQAVNTAALAETPDRWRMLLDFEEAGGPAAVQGRRGWILLSFSEVAMIVGAVPASLLDNEEDLMAFAKVKKVLQRGAGQSAGQDRE